MNKRNLKRRIWAIWLAFCLLFAMLVPVQLLAAQEAAPVGQLKILARYNDSMMPYDGHVYLLFASYKDGVEIWIDDLYKGYEISKQYYEDMARDISSGSNHTGRDADKYFTLRGDMNSVTLNRGEVVTIGMYRAFEMSAEQALIGSIRNSTLGRESMDALKTTIAKSFFDYLHLGQFVGDAPGEAPYAGRLTILSRETSQNDSAPDCLLLFTPYEDIALEVSFYDYYKPTESYLRLMRDYEEPPENYSSDPVIFQGTLDIGDRRSYFEKNHNGPLSAPAVIPIQAGESITLSGYSDEASLLCDLKKALENGQIIKMDFARGLVGEINKYLAGEEINGPLAFDCLLATLSHILTETSEGRANPADGHSMGGVVVNQEVLEQFTGEWELLPNTYYTAELTRQELSLFRDYVAGKDHNYYQIFGRNSADIAADIWNAGGADADDHARRRRLHLHQQQRADVQPRGDHRQGRDGI